MEYTMVIGVIAVTLMAMNVMVKRGIQGMIKTVADQVGTQINAEQTFGDTGYLESSNTISYVTTEKTTVEFAGNVVYGYDNEIITETATVSDLGFQEIRR